MRSTVVFTDTRNFVLKFSRYVFLSIETLRVYFFGAACTYVSLIPVKHKIWRNSFKLL